MLVWVDALCNIQEKKLINIMSFGLNGLRVEERKAYFQSNLEKGKGRGRKLRNFPTPCWPIDLSVFARG
jgi:hypothetical protein